MHLKQRIKFSTSAEPERATNGSRISSVISLATDFRLRQGQNPLSIELKVDRHSGGNLYRSSIKQIRPVVTLIQGLRSRTQQPRIS